MSGVYNMIFGHCPLMPQLMSLLDLVSFETNSFLAPRFRDAYPVLEDGKWVIHVLTRAGGDNRHEYKGGITKLQEHPHYIRDYDEPYDTTYATFVMSTTEDVQAEMQKQLQPELSTLPFKERWENAISIMAAKKTKTKAEG